MRNRFLVGVLTASALVVPQLVSSPVALAAAAGAAAQTVVDATAPTEPRTVAAASAVLGVRVTWAAPTSDGGSAITAYRISSSISGAAPVVEDVPPDLREWIVDTPRPGVSVAASVSAVNAVGTSAAVGAPAARAGAIGGLLRVLPRSYRLMDSGTGLGTAKAPLAARTPRTLTVAGRGGVPSTGVASVWVNVLVQGSTSATSVRVWPTGAARPAAPSAVVPRATRVVAPVQVPLGSGGRLQVENAVGSARVQVDVVGWTLTASASGSSADGKVQVLTSFVLADSRTGVGVPKAAIGAGRAVEVVARGRGGVPSSGVRAVVVNVTTLSSSGAVTWLSASTGGVAATGQTVGVRVGHTVTTRVAIRPSSLGRIRLLNSSGATHVRVEVVGWVSDGTATSAAASGWVATQGARALADTSMGYLTPKAALARGRDLTLAVAGRAGVPTMTSQAPPSAVLARLLVTPVASTVRATVTLRTTGAALPPTWDVTTPTGLPTSNLVWVTLSRGGALTIRNQAASTGSVNLRIEVVGWTVGAGVLLSSKLKVLTASEAAALVPAGGDVFTVAAGQPVPATGSVIAAGVTSQHPGGLLRRVTSRAVQPDGSWTVATRPAALVEAVRDGSATVRVPMQPLVATSPGIASAAGVSARIDDTLATGATVSGSASASTDFDVTLDIGWSGVKASAVASAQHHVDATITASAAAAWDKEIDLGTWEYRWFVFYIGPVPVVVEPSIGLTAFTEGSLKAKATLQYNHGASGSAGMKWDGGLQKVSSFAYDPPSLTGEFEGELAARIGLKVELGLTFYKTGTVKVGLKAHGDAKMAAGDCEIKLSAGLDLTLSVGLEVVGPNLKGSLAVPLKKWDLGGISATGRCLAWTGLVKTDGEVSHNYQPNFESGEPYRQIARAAVTAQYAAPQLGSPDPRITLSGYWYELQPASAPCLEAERTYAASRQTVEAEAPLRLTEGGWEPNLAAIAAVEGTRYTGDTDCGSEPFSETTNAWFFADYLEAPAGLSAPGRVYEADFVEDFHLASDARSVDVTWTETWAQACTRNDVCQVQEPYWTDNYSGEQTVRMRLTQLPDDDDDGIPNITDANPTTVDPL